MNLLNLFVIVTAIFAIISWYLIPKLQNKITTDRSESSNGYSASLAFLGFIRSYALVYMLTTIAVAIVLWIFGSGGAVEASKLDKAIESAQFLKERVSWFSVFWSVITFGLLGLGLALHSRSRGRMRFAKAFEPVSYTHLTLPTNREV